MVFDIPMGTATLVTALIAILQPWAIRVWERYRRRGSLCIYEAGAIEIGYAIVGPTVGLMGTLRAVNEDQFVSRISVSVTRRKDGARHVLEWAVLRPSSLTLGGNQPLSVEIPTGFLIPTAQPYRFNIQFHDALTSIDVTKNLTRARDGWQTYLANSGWQSTVEGQSELVRLTLEYSATPVVLSAARELDRLCYWEAGDYELELRVETTRPDKPYTKRWNFGLTPEHASLLRANANMMTWNTYAPPGGQYYFAYVLYEDAGK